MLLTLLTIGKCKNAGFQTAAQDYARRIGHYASLKELDVREERASSNLVDVVYKEGQRLLKAIPEHAIVIALDPAGKTCTSEALAQKISQWALNGQSRLVFVIGGAYGLAPQVRQRADWRLSLSPMTFPHEMARVIVLEQVYRAFTIIRGESYHK